ncbi:MAG: CapA family protein, partial [Clostridia bacterium]
MAKGKRRRGISAGTVLMLLVTIGCIGVGGWVWERIAGDADFTQFQPARLMQTLAFQGESARVMTEKQSNEQPQTKRAPVQPPATVLAPTPTPAPTARVITLHAVGQIQLDATLRRAYYDAESETYDYSEILQPIAADMAAADLTIATLESTLAGEDAEYGNYNAPDVLLDALKVAGVDLINLSTERILDFGLDGLKRTRDVAESMGFAVVGANRSADEKQMQSSFQINGIRGVILSYTYGLSSTGARVGDDVQRANAVNLLDVDTVKADVARARMQGAEVVIVNVHWGKRS